MEPLSVKEVIGKLKLGNLKPVVELTGFVKKSEKNSEVLFAFKHDLTHWIPIPDTMICGIAPIEGVAYETDHLTLAMIHLKMPVDPETETLYHLLRALAHKVNKYQKIKWLKKMLFADKIKDFSTNSEWKYCELGNKYTQHLNKI